MLSMLWEYVKEIIIVLIWHIAVYTTAYNTKTTIRACEEKVDKTAYAYMKY